MRLAVQLLAAAMAIGLVTAPAAAGAPATQLRAGQPEVLIDSVTPHAPRRRGSVTIQGRLANGGDTTLADPVVQIRFSPTPLLSREEVGLILSGESLRAGTVLPDTIKALNTDLAPGQQVGFRLTTPVRALNLPESAGVYAFFVEALAGGVTQATSGTVVPWFPQTAEYEPSQLSLLWPVTQRPAVAANRLVVDPRVAEEYEPGGRLERLIRLGDTAAVTWLVDTATLQTSREMAGGYQVLTGGREEPGGSAGAARNIAEQLSAAVSNKPWVLLPQFAIADDDALAEGGLTSMVVRSASLPLVIRDSATPGSTAGLGYVTEPGAQRTQSLTTLVDAGVRVALMSDASFPPDPELPYTPSGVTSVDAAGTSIAVVLSDSRLATYLDGPFTTSAERSAALQGILADTAMITLERPAEPRNVAALPPLLWDPPRRWVNQLLKQLTDASWIRLVGVDTILTGGGEVPRQDLGSTPGKGSETLPKRYIRRIERLQEDLEGLTRIVDEPDGFGESFTLALQRASSAHWRRHRNGRQRLLNTVAAQLQTERDRVRVVSSGTVTLAGDSGIVPLTIANDLDRSVTVSAQLRPQEGIGLDYEQPEPVSIDAEAKAGLEIPVRVIGSQAMTVNVVITDSEGQPFSDSASFELRSTAATRIAGVIVGVGGTAFAILVVLNLWRRRRNREQDPQ